jgi:hypothetical protein
VCGGVYVCGVYVHICVGVYVWVWGCMDVCEDVCMYVCGGVWMCVGVYVEYVRVSVYIYIDTRG